MATSPIIRDGDTGEDNARPIRAADAAFGSGSVVSGSLADGIVLSGHISSGQIGKPHIASGAIASGQLGVTGTPDGTKFLRDDFSWQTAGGGLTSGNVQSGHVASGAVQGFFGSTRNIASGTVGVFDLGSGAVVAGTVGSGAVVSGNIASGQIGSFHVASGSITSGRLGVTGSPIGTNFLRDDFTWASPSASLSSGSVGSGAIASGAVQGFFGSTRHIASGTLGGTDFASGATIDTARTIVVSGIPAGMIISGGRLVTYTSGLGLVVAQPESGINFPVFGYAPHDTASGAPTLVITRGLFPVVSGRGGFNPLTWTLPDIMRLSSGGLFNIDALTVVGGTVSGICVPVGMFSVISGYSVLDLAQRDAPFVYPGHLASGSVNSGTIGANSINDGSIASGAFVKGGAWSVGQPNLSGQLNAIIAGEHILGVSGTASWGRLFAISTSGYAVLACNGLSGRMPAVGVALGPVGTGAGESGAILSGLSFRYVLAGRLDQVQILGDPFFGQTSTLSGMEGRVVFTGQSGGMRTDIISGSISQAVGVVFQRSGQRGVYLNPIPQTSGWIGFGQLASGSVANANIASGAVVGQAGGGFSIASGTIGTSDLGNNVVTSANLGSGQVSTVKLASGTPAWGIVNLYTTAELISGLKAVAIASGTGGTIVRAERQSGFRLPAIGVTRSGAASGTACEVVVYGTVLENVSGMIPSGFAGQTLFVGSGGLIVSKSGFMDGASSGAPTLSGSAVQMIGIAISGGLIVAPELRPQSGLVTAAGQGTF